MSLLTMPSFGESAFDCPNCSAYAHQAWYYFVTAMDRAPAVGGSGVPGTPINTVRPKELTISKCQRCGQLAIWFNRVLIHPETITVPQPTDDMPEEVRADYIEAAQIVCHSPRSAAALLRLALQKLCIKLGQPGENLNADIGTLVAQGLPVAIQQALDVVRVIGNNAVHPGEIQLDEDPSIAYALFPLLNMIVERLITQPKQIDGLFAGLPSGAKQAIEKRDRHP